MLKSTTLFTKLRNRIGNSASALTLKRKLFGYMLLLVCLLVIFLISALFLSGQFHSTEKDTFDALDMQMEVYEKDISDHFDSIAAAGINLSRNLTASIQSYLAMHKMSFSDLTDNREHITNLQEYSMEPLMQQLNQENCSGVYLILDTTINSNLENAASSRAGMYLHTNGYKSSYNPVVLLYGNADIARENGIIPHRQWHLEFNTNMFPEYEDFKKSTGEPITKLYRYTDLFLIPGTESRIMLLCVPLIASNGEFYGICGFEISESYFMSYYAQPTKVDYLTYLLTPGSSDTINTQSGFSCGDSDGYYRTPAGTLSAKELGNGLYTYRGDEL